MNIKIILSALAILPALGASAFASSQTGIVNYEYLNVRTQPGSDKSVSFLLKKGDEVKILSENDGWFNIEYNMEKGWVQTAALNTKQVNNSTSNNSTSDNLISSNSTSTYSSKGVVKFVDSDTLSLRTEPTTNSEIITDLKKGQKVKVLEESIGWAKCDCDGQIGYLSSRMLVSEDNLESLKNNSNSNDEEIIENDSSNDLSKYKNATTNSNSTGVEDFKLINTSQPDLYAPGTVGEPVESTAKNTLTVNTEKLYMRTAPSSLSSHIDSMKKGDVVEFVSYSKGWYKIKFNGKEGYAFAQFLDNNANKQISNANGSTTYRPMNISLEQFVDIQLSNSGRNVNAALSFNSQATRDDLLKYMNPNNYKDYSGMMQFARLDQYTNCITANELNNYLNKNCPPGNVFHNKGQAFIDAAKKYNINVLYLVAHSMVETGYGQSSQARGSMYNGQIVYNFYGIGAVDGNSRMGGLATAYKFGWTSPEAGLDGAAQWIASGYIHNSTYRQNTLYQMKWSKDFVWHQYATGIGWPSLIGQKMADIGKYSTATKLISYEIPQFN